MFEQKPVVIREPRQVHCPFCGWHRLAQTVGVEAWDPDKAMLELGDHLTEHPDEWIRLLSAAGEWG